MSNLPEEQRARDGDGEEEEEQATDEVVSVVVAAPVRRWVEWTREQGTALTAFGLSAALPLPLLVVGGILLNPIVVTATVVRVAPTPLVTYVHLGVLHENEFVRLPPGARVGDRVQLPYNQLAQELYADGQPPGPALAQLLLVLGVALGLVLLAVAISLVRIPPLLPARQPLQPKHKQWVERSPRHQVIEQVIDSALWASLR